MEGEKYVAVEREKGCFKGDERYRLNARSHEKKFCVFHKPYISAGFANFDHSSIVETGKRAIFEHSTWRSFYLKTNVIIL